MALDFCPDLAPALDDAIQEAMLLQDLQAKRAAHLASLQERRIAAFQEEQETPKARPSSDDDGRALTGPEWLSLQGHKLAAITEPMGEAVMPALERSTSFTKHALGMGWEATSAAVTVGAVGAVVAGAAIGKATVAVTGAAIDASRPAVAKGWEATARRQSRPSDSRSERSARRQRKRRQRSAKRRARHWRAPRSRHDAIGKGWEATAEATTKGWEATQDATKHALGKGWEATGSAIKAAGQATVNATPVVATFAGAAVVATTGAALVAAGAAAKVGQTAAAKVGEGISLGLGATKDGVDAVVEKVKQRDGYSSATFYGASSSSSVSSSSAASSRRRNQRDVEIAGVEERTTSPITPTNHHRAAAAQAAQAELEEGSEYEYEDEDEEVVSPGPVTAELAEKMRNSRTEPFPGAMPRSEAPEARRSLSDEFDSVSDTASAPVGAPDTAAAEEAAKEVVGAASSDNKQQGDGNNNPFAELFAVFIQSKRR